MGMLYTAVCSWLGIDPLKHLIPELRIGQVITGQLPLSQQIRSLYVLRLHSSRNRYLILLWEGRRQSQSRINVDASFREDFINVAISIRELLRDVELWGRCDIPRVCSVCGYVCEKVEIVSLGRN